MIIRTGRLLAVLSVILQVFLPGLMPLGQGRGFDVAGLLCAPSGNAPSAEAVAVLEIFAELREEEEGGEPAATDHCPLCALAHGTPVPLPLVLPVPHGYSGHVPFIRFEPQFAERPQGPPLGSRAPPLHA